MELLYTLKSFTNWQFYTSIKAIVVVALVVIVQTLFHKKLSAKWLHALWFLVMARSIIPFEIPSPTSIYNYLSAQPQTFQNTTVFRPDVVHAPEIIMQKNPTLHYNIPSQPVMPKYEFLSCLDFFTFMGILCNGFGHNCSGFKH